MESRSDEPAKALTIAGSDSGGAAGLQADLKTFTALGVYGMTVVTVVTAQSSVSVDAVYTLPTDMVARQLGAVLGDYGAGAVKTGFIGSEHLVGTIARELNRHRAKRSFFLIVDPVLVNHRAEAMFDPVVVDAYREYLLPFSDLTTPNCAEAALLTEQAVTTLAEMRAAAHNLHDRGARHVLITGGRIGDHAVDLFFDGQSHTVLPVAWLETENTHGAGDTLSAGITALMAQGLSMHEAVRQAQTFTATAIRGARQWRLGAGHGPLNHLAPRGD